MLRPITFERTVEMRLNAQDLLMPLILLAQRIVLGIIHMKPLA